MPGWGSFPAEIRMVVLEMVAEDYSFKSEPQARAGYASVCREWQPVFEQRNFQRLVLDQERISGLERFMGEKGRRHRREYLEHVFLRVRLDEYDCTACQSKEDDETVRNNDHTFSRAVWDLLIILSKWTGDAQSRGHRGSQQGLTLELGVYSPSDCKHTFRDFRLEHNYPYHEAKDLEMHWESYKLQADRLGLDSLKDPYHGVVDGLWNDASLESKQRIMGTLTFNLGLSGFSASKLPKVEIVTRLLIHRQFYRKIAASSLRKLLRESFTCLRWFRHEGWHDVNPQQQSCFEKDYKSLISKSLPSTLRNLHIFEDFNHLLHPERSSTRASPSLGKTLSKSSRFLENLSAAFLVDAEHFFADFWPTKPPKPSVVPWENLRTLALTSRLLHPEIGRGKINKLLMAAGRAAAFMPKLEMMEIWNGCEKHACLFRYSNDAGEPQITWACDWGVDVQLAYSVIHCWANLSKGMQHPHGNLTAAIHRLPRRRKKMKKTHVTAIRYLKLRRSVLDLISDYQLCWEERNNLRG